MAATDEEKKDWKEKAFAAFLNWRTAMGEPSLKFTDYHEWLKKQKKYRSTSWVNLIPGLEHIDKDDGRNVLGIGQWPDRMEANLTMNQQQQGNVVNVLPSTTTLPVTNNNNNVEPTFVSINRPSSTNVARSSNQNLVRLTLTISV